MMEAEHWKHLEPAYLLKPSERKRCGAKQFWTRASGLDELLKPPGKTPRISTGRLDRSWNRLPSARRVQADADVAAIAAIAVVI